MFVRKIRRRRAKISDVAEARIKAVTDLDLGFLPIESPDLASNPMPYFDAARARHPWLARCEVGYVVHAYQAMKELLWMDDKLRTSNDSVVEIMGAKDTFWGEHIGRQILAQSGATHQRLRASVSAAFTPRNINRYRALMRTVISDLLDEWAPKGRFDVAEFAAHFPITIVSAVIGAPRESVQPILKHFETFGLVFSLNPSLLPAFDEALGEIWAFVDRLVVEREASGGGDPDEILNSLIAARNAGTIDDTELRDLLTFIFNAGYDTSKNMITLIMYTMLDHPDYWARCAEDPLFCRKVVQEQFRYRSVSSPYRTVAEEFVYRDVRLAKDALLVFPFPLSGRDPTAFDDPDEFNPLRIQKNGHIGFGRGMHMCLGQHLAKAQIEEGIHVMAQRLTRLKPAGDIAWRPFAGVWGLRTLPIEFVPAPRRRESETVKAIDATATGAPED